MSVLAAMMDPPNQTEEGMSKRRKANSHRPGHPGWLHQLGPVPSVVQLVLRGGGTLTASIPDATREAISAHLQRVIAGIENGRIPRCPHVRPGTSEPFMASASAAYCYKCPTEVMASLVLSGGDDRSCDVCCKSVVFPGGFTTVSSKVGTLTLLTATCEDCSS